tara:strand:+ start:106 stop:993 length:888 start_codon:yes stop_codon:yes gene_type:complete
MAKKEMEYCYCPHCSHLNSFQYVKDAKSFKCSSCEKVVRWEWFQDNTDGSKYAFPPTYSSKMSAKIFHRSLIVKNGEVVANPKGSFLVGVLIIAFGLFIGFIKDSTGVNLFLPFEIFSNLINGIMSMFLGGDGFQYILIALGSIGVLLGVAIIGIVVIGGLMTLFENLPLSKITFDSSKYQYKVYKNPQNIYNAVKVGWSHPAFFFGFFWCLVKQIWVYAGVVFAIGFVFGATGNMYLDLIATLGVMIWMGSSGNELYAQSLRDKGYDLLTTLNAKTPEGAIAQYHKDTNEDKED